MGKLDDYKSKLPSINGSTTINHEARVRLGLTCSEYVLMSHLANIQEKKKKHENLSFYLSTGFGPSEITALFKALIGKGFVYISNPAEGDYEVTSKWNDGFADIEKEFDNKFWKVDGKVAWTGTRKKALEYYVKLRKRHAKDFLVKQRDDYFTFLDLQYKLRNFDQQKTMCQVFLNPMNERYLEDYADYIVQLKAKYGDPDKPTPKPVSKEEIMKEYGKDHNK